MLKCTPQKRRAINERWTLCATATEIHLNTHFDSFINDRNTTFFGLVILFPPVGRWRVQPAGAVRLKHTTDITRRAFKRPTAPRAAPTRRREFNIRGSSGFGLRSWTEPELFRFSLRTGEFRTSVSRSFVMASLRRPASSILSGGIWSASKIFHIPGASFGEVCMQNNFPASWCHRNVFIHRLWTLATELI